MDSASIQTELAEILQELAAFNLHLTEHISIRGRVIKFDDTCDYCRRFQGMEK